MRKSDMETSITLCDTEPWEFAVRLRKLKRGLCTHLGGGVGQEIHAYLWLIHVEG